MSDQSRGGRERKPTAKGQALQEARAAAATRAGAAAAPRKGRSAAGSSTGKPRSKQAAKRKQGEEAGSRGGEATASASATPRRKWAQTPAGRARMLAMAKAAKVQDPAEALSAAISIVDRLGLSFGDILNALEENFGFDFTRMVSDSDDDSSEGGDPADNSSPAGNSEGAGDAEPWPVGGIGPGPALAAPIAAGDEQPVTERGSSPPPAGRANGGSGVGTKRSQR